MIKKLISRKIVATTAVLFALFLLYMIPGTKLKDFQNEFPQKLEYVDSNALKSVIYLLDSHQYLGRAEVVITTREVEGRAKELLDVLIKSGAGENKVPSGFQSILPSDTKIISVKFDDGVLKVNFSKELLEVEQNMEQKMVEAIVFTLTNIEGVEKIIIYVENEVLTKLPKSNVNLPSALDRGFGINKQYDITSSKNIEAVTVYYVNKYNDKYYYVPITKYSNDDREKVKIIIDELTSGYSYHTNLMSFLNHNTKLLSTTQSDNRLLLEFNEYIFDNNISKKILEEVIYTISLSIGDNYNVNEVVFQVDDEEIHKSVLKSIE